MTNRSLARDGRPSGRTQVWRANCRLHLHASSYRRSARMVGQFSLASRDCATSSRLVGRSVSPVELHNEFIVVVGAFVRPLLEQLARAG